MQEITPNGLLKTPSDIEVIGKSTGSKMSLIRIGIPYDTWKPIVHNPTILVKAVDPPFGANGNNINIASNANTNKIAFTGLFKFLLTDDKNSEYGNSLSRVNA